MPEYSAVSSCGPRRDRAQRRPVHALWLLMLGAIVVWSGCASNSETFEAPPETRPPVESPGPAEAEPSEREVEKTDDDLTIVIDEGDPDESARRTLLETAAAERERRRQSGPPAIVITNENLNEHATGELTIVSSGGVKKVTSEEGGQVSAEGDPRGEQYWRGRVLRVRQDWSTTREEIKHLESRAADLRRRFYAEDDPYYRDTQIKPSWDRTLERLTEARVAVEAFRGQVDEILEEGRQAGALPGWLREGIELEPKGEFEEGSRRLEEHEPQEPTVVEDDGQIDPP